MIYKSIMVGWYKNVNINIPILPRWDFFIYVLDICKVSWYDEVPSRIYNIVRFLKNYPHHVVLQVLFTGNRSESGGRHGSLSAHNHRFI